jgi:hypothetical protein
MKVHDNMIVHMQLFQKFIFVCLAYIIMYVFKFKLSM